MNKIQSEITDSRCVKQCAVIWTESIYILNQAEILLSSSALLLTSVTFHLFINHSFSHLLLSLPASYTMDVPLVARGPKTHRQSFLYGPLTHKSALCEKLNSSQLAECSTNCDHVTRPRSVWQKFSEIIYTDCNNVIVSI